MVLAVSRRAPPTPRYSGTGKRKIQKRVRGSHPLQLSFPAHSTYRKILRIPALQPPYCRNRMGLGSSPFARHYWGNHYCFLLLRLLRCFSSARSPPTEKNCGMPCLQHGRLTHSEIRGSNRMCRYPQLIAAYHVLHRLWEPRHPPCALINHISLTGPFANR